MLNFEAYEYKSITTLIISKKYNQQAREILYQRQVNSEKHTLCEMAGKA